MDLTKIYADSDFSNAVVPAGQILVFTGLENKKPVTRYKDSSGNFGTLSGNGGGSDVTLGQVNAEGKFQPLAFNGTEASNSGNPEAVEAYYGFNGVLPVPESGSGGGMNFYKCASVDPANKTWTGYKAVLTGGVYTFEENATEGLTYGDAYTPRVDYIYNSNTTVQISKLWDGIIVPQEGLVFYASLTDLTTAETGQALTSTLVVPTVVDGIHCAQFSGNGGVTATIDPINDYGTTSLWFRTDSYDTAALFVLSGNSGVEWNMYARGGYISFGRGGLEYNPAEFSLNTWHHFVCTSNKGVVAIYLDGQNVYSGTLDASGGSTLQLSRNSEPYSGYLANVRVYNRPLDIDEVVMLYNELSPSA